MKAIRKRPGCEPEIIEVENTLKAFQTEVDGRIEAVTISADIVAICNEEGLLRGLPFNCWFFNMPFVGTLLVVGYDRDEFCDVRGAGIMMEVLRHG